MPAKRKSGFVRSLSLKKLVDQSPERRIVLGIIDSSDQRPVDLKDH